PGLRVFAGVMIVGRGRDGVVGKSGRKRGGEIPKVFYLNCRELPESGAKYKVYFLKLKGNEGTNRFSRLGKLEFPRFYGDDVQGWFLIVKQFFAIDNVHDEDKVKIMSIHLYDRALAWHLQFIKVHRELWMFRPKTLADAFSLANFQEASLAIVSQKSTLLLQIPGNTTSYYANRNVNYLNKTTTLALPAPNTQVVTKHPTITEAPPRKQLSQKKLAEKRAKNLCFYCDQKYMTGHKYSGQMYALKVSPYKEENEFIEYEVEQIRYDDFTKRRHELLMSECYPHDHNNLHIFLKALSVIPTFNIMRIKRSVSKHLLHLLMDTGNTHNFLDIYTAKKLGCKLRKTCPILATVDEGNKLVRGCEMVLGIQWFSTLGNIKWNFQELVMKFVYEVTLLWTTYHLLNKIVKDLQEGTTINSKYTWHNQQLIRKIKWVVGADTTLRNKVDFSSYLGLLQPFPILNQVWKDISKDFIDSLPSSQGKTGIMVVVDKLRQEPTTPYSKPERFFHQTKKKKKRRNPFIPVEERVPKVKYPPFANLFEALVVYNQFPDLLFLMADDQPMWGKNQAVAPTPGAAIVAVDLGDTFTVKVHYLSMIKDRQFDGHMKAKPIRKTVAFSKNSNDSKLMEKMESMTTKSDSQFKEIKGEMKEMREGCNGCGDTMYMDTWSLLSGELGWQKMLSLRNSNHDPPIDFYNLEGSDDYTKVTYDKEQCLSDHYIAPVTSPAYTPSIPFLATMEPVDTFLMGARVISTTPEKENNEFIKSSVNDLVPIPRESEVTSIYDDLECSMPLYSSPSHRLDVLGERKVFNEPLGNSDLVPKSYNVTFSNPLFDFNDDYTLYYDNPLFDEEFEDISSLDPLESTPVIDESS
nr:hypothetical protein [Tanacetum cinerariifolium]